MLTDTDDKQTRWAYRCLMRPPMPGAVPKDGLVECDFNERFTPRGKHYWGRVFYDRQLTEKEVADHELEYLPRAVTD